MKSSKTTHTTNNYSNAFTYLVVTIGFAVCVFSSLRLPTSRIDVGFIFLATFTVLLGSRIGTEFSNHKIQVTASDTLVFLTLLLYGYEAAVLVAAGEAFYSSFRFAKLWLIRAFNSSVLAISTFLTGTVIVSLFGSEIELSKGSFTADFAIAICILAFVQYATNTSIAAFRISLKTGQPLLKTWKDNFFWISITYFAGASAAGITAKLIYGNGFYAFVAIIPIITIIYFTYKSYCKQIESKTEQAEQAILYAAEQERVSNILRESEEHFRGAFDYAAVGMALFGKDGRWLRVNQSFCTLVGYSEKELLATDFQSITHPEDLQNFLEEVSQILSGNSITVTTEKRYVHKQGQDIWTVISTSTVNDSEGKPVHFIMQAQDITKRKLAEDQLNHAAFYDSLTSLPNRALFIKHLQLTIDKNSGNGDCTYAVLFLDIDRFKNINDSLGHVIGDQLLINAARRLEKCVRSGDIVSRLGGDEFAILLNNLKNATDATATAERIQKELSLPFSLAGYEVFSGASIGVALSTHGYTESVEILRDADTAMYRAKENSKGSFEIFDKVMHSRAILRLQLENDLRRAVERNEFEVFYQPIMNLITNSISGFEALVRWKHPERGLVSPFDFIPVAEETELIIPIGDWVLMESCRQVKEWQSKWAFPAPLTISVNLSGKQFKQIDLVQRIKQILNETRLEAQDLRLEITESVVMDNAEEATAMLNQLRSLGVQLSIDDFGTGYSSLSYLHRFPVNILKVDRSFVSRMSVDNESLGIVETIIALASKLKMKVVAEGVETQDQKNQLKTFNCEYGQGYLFSKPVPAREAQDFIEKQWQQLIKQGFVSADSSKKQFEEIDEDCVLSVTEQNYFIN
ncbi:MAG: EAL domain-containing protein [Pyrinomonadaceae bacterium]|nr:EAL domain-containing protein [Pyrinomonadaceae bacterium]